MATEAQMIMTLSMKKIVESRNRRGGASLHRNLLVAGVLFKARDVFLAVSAVTAAADGCQKSSATDDSVAKNLDVDRKSDDEDEMECERTVAEMTSSSADVCSRLDDKENVPPFNQPSPAVTPDHPRCDDVEPSTDKTRAVKRLSRDMVDDDVTPCKTTRADTPVEGRDRGFTESVMDDADDNVDVACSNTVGDEVCRQTCSSMPVSPSSSSREAVPTPVVRRSSTVSRLPSLDSRLTPTIGDPLVVRPLFVVQVV